MSKPLEGKTALVTGASRGLGRAIAQDLAERGALVAINYAANDAAANETLAAIEAKGGQAFLIRKKLGGLQAAEELAAELDEALTHRTGSSGLDILVNNAGGGPVHDLDSTTEEIFQSVLADNLGGPFYVTKALKARLRDHGRVIFMSSVGARKALPQYVVYAMAKSAVETFTRVMAQELGGRGITVNCLMPGVIASDANADIRSDPGSKKFFEDNTLLRRFGEPSDLSGVVVSLVSPKMGYVTGQIIEVSGGLFF
ncbi:SDR family NAD(P)-dependent oxidoreductase [Phenylobacterium sp. LjRoot225]|uniref:SDR family NAD(P)-dependent oxidoreductase n=1 Tax=Phenylobacterium sp. LjRoot225 TaxID=3342285 RepID=UPI003F4FBB7C